MKKFRALDLFCGAGGASMGLHRAGFDVTGVDIKPQPRYPFAFVQADALRMLGGCSLRGFDLIWASPPCQAYSKTRKILEGKGLKNRGEDLIAAVRSRLKGQNYVIENVPGAPLGYSAMLCGTMFGLPIYRHRYFECSAQILTPPHTSHNGSTGSHRGYSKGHAFITVGGHNYNAAQGKRAMQIDWMTRDELNEAIPPAYSQYIGERILDELSRNHEDRGEGPNARRPANDEAAKYRKET